MRPNSKVVSAIYCHPKATNCRPRYLLKRILGGALHPILLFAIGCGSEPLNSRLPMKNKGNSKESTIEVAEGLNLNHWIDCTGEIRKDLPFPLGMNFKDEKGSTGLCQLFPDAKFELVFIKHTYPEAENLKQRLNLELQKAGIDHRKVLVVGGPNGEMETLDQEIDLDSVNVEELKALIKELLATIPYDIFSLDAKLNWFAVRDTTQFTDVLAADMMNLGLEPPIDFNLDIENPNLPYVDLGAGNE